MSEVPSYKFVLDQPLPERGFSTIPAANVEYRTRPHLTELQNLWIKGRDPECQVRVLENLGILDYVPPEQNIDSFGGFFDIHHINTRSNLSAVAYHSVDGRAPDPNHPLNLAVLKRRPHEDLHSGLVEVFRKEYFFLDEEDKQKMSLEQYIEGETRAGRATNWRNGLDPYLTTITTINSFFRITNPNKSNIFPFDRRFLSDIGEAFWQLLDYGTHESPEHFILFAKYCEYMNKRDPMWGDFYHFSLQKYEQYENARRWMKSERSEFLDLKPRWQIPRKQQVRTLQAEFREVKALNRMDRQRRRNLSRAA